MVFNFCVSGYLPVCYVVKSMLYVNWSSQKGVAQYFQARKGMYATT